MSTAGAPPRNSTVAQLKADIDRGLTGDKVSNPDPGLSPLGTDDEAAGTPARPETIDRVRRQEAAIGADARATQASAKPERAWVIPSLLTALLLIVVAAAVFGLTR